MPQLPASPSGIRTINAVLTPHSVVRMLAQGFRSQVHSPVLRHLPA